MTSKKEDATNKTVISWIEVCVLLGTILWGATAYYINSEIAMNKASMNEKLHSIELQVTEINTSMNLILELNEDVAANRNKIHSVQLELASLKRETR